MAVKALVLGFWLAVGWTIGSWMTRATMEFLLGRAIIQIVKGVRF